MDLSLEFKAMVAQAYMSSLFVAQPETFPAFMAWADQEMKTYGVRNTMAGLTLANARELADKLGMMINEIQDKEAKI